MHVNRDLDHCEKRKRGKRIFGFHSFGDPACPADYYGAFRENIRIFLEDCAEREDYNVGGMPVWSIDLREDYLNTQITVFVIEELVHNSVHPHCDHCRCIGWRHHLVSNQRYHFIIPADSDSGNGVFRLDRVNIERVCPSCRARVPSGQQSCLTCCIEAGQASVLDTQSHILHGMLHTNGFGHLLCFNGREAGSKYVSGRDIMDLWDRICAMLRARKVSVEDIAKKRSMEFRLLHSVAYGESWCSRWGYKFGHGSFGITQQMYRKAIEAIQGMPLTLLTQDFQGVDQDVIAIAAMYQRLSGQILQTLGDLFRFMLELKARLPLDPSKTTSISNGGFKGGLSLFNNIIHGDLPCRWSIKRLELATQVIVEALKNCEKKWVPRQDVRDAARVYIGDTGLLDFVLKTIGNRVVGTHVVRRTVNPNTKVLEYSLEDVNNAFLDHRIPVLTTDWDGFSDISRAQIRGDIFYMYKHVLENYKPAMERSNVVSTAIPTAVRIILDTTQFIKDHGGETSRKAATNEFGMDDDEMLRVMCAIHVFDDGGSTTRRCPRPPSPPELVVLPPHATVGDLKKQAERAFRDTYYVMRGFQVESIPDLEGDDDDLLFGTIESGTTVAIRGIGIDLRSDLLYEGGSDEWRVECRCGATDDDGERMIACDVCEVWQHTRCAGISDMDAIPQIFLCNGCRPGLFQHML